MLFRDPNSNCTGTGISSNTHRILQYGSPYALRVQTFQTYFLTLQNNDQIIQDSLWFGSPTLDSLHNKYIAGYLVSILLIKRDPALQTQVQYIQVYTHLRGLTV